MILLYYIVVQCTHMCYYYFIIAFIIIYDGAAYIIRRGTRCSRLCGVAEVYDRINGHDAYHVHTVPIYIYIYTS